MPASLFSATTINANYPATMVVAASNPPQTVLLFNNDPSNTIWLADNNAFQGGDPNHAAPLGPLSSATFDGTRDVYASTVPGQTAAMAIYPTGSSYSQGNGIIALAQLGSVTGGAAALLVPGTGFAALSLANVSGFTSYDLNAYAFAQSPGGVNSGIVAQIQIQWFDDLVSGLPVFEEDWWIWVGRATPTAGVNTLAGNGPMHGRYMTVNVFAVNSQAADTVLQYINIFGSNRTVPYSDWRQNGAAVNPQSNGITLQAGGGTSFDNMLADIVNLPLGASASVFVPMGLYSGPVYYRFQATGTAPLHDPVILNMNAQVSGGIAPGTGSASVLVNLTADTNEHEGTFFAGRSPCSFVIQGNTSTTTFSFQAIAQQAA